MVQSYGMYLIRGLDGIGKAIGKHRNTARRWIQIHGLPACKDPFGEYITTQPLIDQWIMARGKEQKLFHGCDT